MLVDCASVNTKSLITLLKIQDLFLPDHSIIKNNAKKRKAASLCAILCWREGKNIAKAQIAGRYVDSLQFYLLFLCLPLSRT